MTKKNKQILLWGALAGGVAFLYFRMRGGAGLGLGSIFGASTGTNVNPAGGSGVATPSLDYNVIALRGAATGPLSRHACALPKRWINTTSGPYYGHCVTQAQFNEWLRQTIIPAMGPDPTEAQVRSYFSTRGGL
jgi:hypothetical protein